MLVTLNEVLPKAQKEKYAVGLFNTIDMEMANGVLAAAENMKSPVIIGTAEILLPFGGLEEQKRRLEKDGIAIENGKVDLVRYRWLGALGKDW